MDDSLFTRLGPDRYRAGALARGPWDPEACHGGPPSALVAGVLDAALAATGLGTFFPARFTAELTRPVPLGELRVEARVRRPGKRICVADAALVDDAGATCLTATLLGIRDRPFDRETPPVDDPPPNRERGWAAKLSDRGTPGPSFARDAVEHRVVAGRFEDSGPATDWIRLTAPMVDGRPPTALERTVALADFGNGVSKWFDMGDVLFINPDLNVQLFRLPEGEWLCLDAVTRLGPHGVGQAESLLSDDLGAVGRATQSLLVEERE